MSASDKKLDPDRPIFAKSMERYIGMGLIAILVLVVGFGGWAAMANISGAVVAPGKVAVGSRVKEIQHREGGIVREILVEDGDRVKAGQLLILLDDTQSRAARDVVSGQLIAYRARMDRLAAERDHLDGVTFRDTLEKRAANDPVIAEILSSQRGIFAARRATQAGQTTQLDEQLSQLDEQIKGLDAQRGAKQREIVLVNDELADLRQLLERDLVPRSRVVGREREAVRLEGEEGDLTSRIATARGRMAEIRVQKLQVEKEFQQTVLDDIERLQTEIATLTERTVAADDELSRVEVVAPVAGLVHEMAVSTVGGVIAPGATILKIVPDSDELIVEAQVSPINVDEISMGQDAHVMFSGLSSRETPRLNAVVQTISADSTRDEQTRMDFFTVRISLTEEEIERLGGDVTLTPGMPAEVFIRTRDRSVLDFLIEPLLEAANVTFREG
ncbi:HlyD family type I secretion periplasmic adaptor subunit [Acuticoccus sp. MNP-M23]|uniref:HlyD family type I secretion periplasmic adaptor subunit n=1 Tax=Acuticoccus sp. MNP-M23 TaxID=3072793 RepID=UPI002815A965|nr:HlyD family type I secretion periplasmic adaptor subunit [Acuticoccus sp. MNP-M23]WMS41506.1 HlyD family type I secretion periplasmic adaptor subunit [Acuticoccus sp. MNP-M23]